MACAWMAVGALNLRNGTSLGWPQRVDEPVLVCCYMHVHAQSRVRTDSSAAEDGQRRMHTTRGSRARWQAGAGATNQVSNAQARQRAKVSAVEWHQMRRLVAAA